MNWQYDPTALGPLLTTPIALCLALYALGHHRRKVPGALAVTVMLIAASIWTLENALQILATGDASRWLAIQVRTLGMTAVPVALLILSLTYAEQHRWLRWPRWPLLVVVPLVTIVLGWTNSFHGLMWQTPPLETGATTAEIYGSFGVARWVNLGYNYLMVIIAIMVLLRLRRESETRAETRARTNAVLLGVGLTLAANLAFRFRPNLLPVDLTPIMFVLAGFALATRVLQMGGARLLRLAPAEHPDAVPTPILVLDEAKCVADFNQAAQEQFVLGRETALGTPLKQLLGNPILVSKALEKSTVEPVEVTLAPSGTERIYLVKSSSLEQRQGQALGRVTVWHDITEWREAERSLQENESFLRQVINSNPHHISVKHRGGRFLLVNKAKAAFHGLPVESFVGETAHLFLNDATKAEEQTQADLEVITQDNTKQFPAVATTHGVTGETHWFETTVTPLKGTDGTPLGVLSIETDISNLKRYEQNIDRQVRFEQLINRISGEFINQEPGTFDATIATALGAIAGFMEADRGGIIRLDDEQASITCTHEWSGTGIKLQFPQSSPLDLPQKPWWLHRLRADETVFIPHLDQLPPPIRSSLQAEEARSLVAIPISIKSPFRSALSRGLTQLG